MPDLNWEIYHSHSSDSVRIINFLFNHGFEQLVTLPTHINGNILDLIFVNFSTCQISEVGTGNTDFSDHFLISFQCYFDNKKTQLSNCNHKVHIPPEIYSYLQLELASSIFFCFLLLPVKTILMTDLKTSLSFYPCITERSAKNVKMHPSIILPTPCTS